MTEKIVYVNFSEIDTEQSFTELNPQVADENILANIQDVSISANVSETSVTGSTNESGIIVNSTQSGINASVDDVSITGTIADVNLTGDSSINSITANISDASLNATISSPDTIGIVVHNPLIVEISSSAVYASVPDVLIKANGIGEPIQERIYGPSLFKGTDEYLYANDYVSFASAFFRSFEDTASSYDEITNNLGKIPLDQATIVEYFAKDSSKFFNEQTDLQDTVSKDFSRPFDIDYYNVSDIFSNGPNKVTDDSTTSSDVFTKDFGKIPLETINATENVFIVTTFNRTFTDTVTAIDTISNELSRIFTETTTTSDLIQTLIFTEFLINALESLAASDSLDRTLDKALQETQNVTDDILGEAVIDDDQIFGFNKNLIDSSASSDTISIGPNKIFAESLSSAESGIIYNQGYFADVTYVQLYYVGDVRTIG